MPILYSTGLSNTEISILESTYSISFPLDYKLFLTTYNGYRISSPDYCDLPYDNVDDGFIAFDVLFGSKILNENFCLEHINNEFLDEIAHINDTFLIGEDSGGNFYILITQGDQQGVYYWDRTGLHINDEKKEHSYQGINNYSNIYKTHNSFTAFFEEIALTVGNKEKILSLSL